MTTFSGFTAEDFDSMESVSKRSLPKRLQKKIDALRYELGQFPEFQLPTFKHRIVRRPRMRGETGLVFGHARAENKHWYLYVVGGDQDQVQLNIGMYRHHMRIGLGFQIGRQVNPKIPAFHLLQAFLGTRPPLPFRDAFFQMVKNNGFRIEDRGCPIDCDTANLLEYLETFVVPADEVPTFVLIGAIWSKEDAVGKLAEDFRRVFREVLPFYEALLLMGGRFAYYD